MSRLKRIVRRSIARVLYYSGLLWIYAEFRLRGKATVLMYHRVLPSGADTFSHEGIIVSPQTFAAQMRFLNRHFRPLTSVQFGAQLSSHGFGRRACLVTFDDGWHDNFQHAFPVLQQQNIPAVFFITTAYIGTTTTFWQERLTRLLYLASLSSGFGEGVLRDLDAIDVRYMTFDQAKLQLRKVVTSLKMRDFLTIEHLLTRLEKSPIHSGNDALNFGVDQFLNWDQVLELQQSGLVTIGSHAHSHTPLPSLGYDGAKIELARSRREIQDHGIQATTVCAYPNGDVDDSVAAAAKDAGFALGFGTRKGPTCHGDDPLRLPRINVHEQSSATRAEFLCLILGVL